MSQRTTNYPSLNGTEPVRLASTEVKPKRDRRTFTAKYKLAILAEADRSQESGDIGALLRREGLYSSNLTNWRRQRDAGELAPGAVKRRRDADGGKKEAADQCEQAIIIHQSKTGPTTMRQPCSVCAATLYLMAIR